MALKNNENNVNNQIKLLVINLKNVSRIRMLKIKVNWNIEIIRSVWISEGRDKEILDWTNQKTDGILSWNFGERK